MNDQEYIYYELSKAKPSLDYPTIRIKMTGSKGESRWVSLPDHVVDLVKAVACLTEEEARNLEDLVVAAAVMGDDNLGFGRIRDRIAKRQEESEETA